MELIRSKIIKIVAVLVIVLLIGGTTLPVFATTTTSNSNSGLFGGIIKIVFNIISAFFSRNSNNSISFQKPVNEVTAYLSSGYSSGHKAIDITCKGTNNNNISIFASYKGKVITAGWHNSYGNYIVIEHKINENTTFKTLYAHCKELKVKKGDNVYKGEKIAVMGNTGESKGTHLHFKITKNGVIQNPSNYVKY